LHPFRRQILDLFRIFRLMLGATAQNFTFSSKLRAVLVCR
jgi:hypothetical protein